MIHLIAAVCCSTAIALILKRGEERNLNRFVILAMNYTMATSAALLFSVRKNLFHQFQGASFPGLVSELSSGHCGVDGFLTAPGSALWAVVIGIPTGVLYFLGFYYYQRSAKESGVGLAGSYAKLGILVPVALSMILWQEYPGGLQWAGMALAVASIAMVNLPLRDIKPALLLLFLTCGVSEFTNKLYQRYGCLEVKDLFLFVLFLTALLISAGRIRRKPSREEILTGLAVGVPNFFASFFLINALSALPASVVFPVYSAGSIALICIGGRVFYSERLSRKETAAIALTMAAMLLINL